MISRHGTLSLPVFPFCLPSKLVILDGSLKVDKSITTIKSFLRNGTISPVLKRKQLPLRWNYSSVVKEDPKISCFLFLATSFFLNLGFWISGRNLRFCRAIRIPHKGIYLPILKRYDKIYHLTFLSNELQMNKLDQIRLSLLYQCRYSVHRDDLSSKLNSPF